MRKLSLTTAGESHGPGYAVIIDGCPAGLELSEADLQPDLDRRRPGQSKIVTQRDEPDTAEILSGVFEGKTTGTPIAILIRNQDQRSRDYSDIKDLYRAGHADYTFDAKFGFRDYRVITVIASQNKSVASRIFFISLLVLFFLCLLASFLHIGCSDIANLKFIAGVRNYSFLLIDMVDTRIQVF